MGAAAGRMQLVRVRLRAWGTEQQGPLAPWHPAGGLGGRHLQGQEGLTSPTALSEAAGPPQGPLEPPAQTHLVLYHLPPG